MKQKLSRHDRAGSGSRFVTHQEMRRGCAVKAGEDGLAMTIMTIMLSRSWAPLVLREILPIMSPKGNSVSDGDIIGVASALLRLG